MLIWLRLCVPEIQRFSTLNRNRAASGCALTASSVANSLAVSTPLRGIALRQYSQKLLLNLSDRKNGTRGALPVLSLRLRSCRPACCDAMSGPRPLRSGDHCLPLSGRYGRCVPQVFPGQVRQQPASSARWSGSASHPAPPGVERLTGPVETRRRLLEQPGGVIGSPFGRCQLGPGFQDSGVPPATGPSGGHTLPGQEVLTGAGEVRPPSAAIEAAR